MPAVRPDRCLTNETECVLKSTVQGRTGVNDGILGCPACVSGFFLENKTCHACQTRFDSCMVCFPHAVHGMFRIGLRLG